MFLESLFYSAAIKYNAVTLFAASILKHMEACLASTSVVFSDTYRNDLRKFYRSTIYCSMVNFTACSKKCHRKLNPLPMDPYHSPTRGLTEETILETLSDLESLCSLSLLQISDLISCWDDNVVSLSRRLNCLKDTKHLTKTLEEALSSQKSINSVSPGSFQLVVESIYKERSRSFAQSFTLGFQLPIFYHDDFQGKKSFSSSSTSSLIEILRSQLNNEHGSYEGNEEIDIGENDINLLIPKLTSTSDVPCSLFESSFSDYLSILIDRVNVDLSKYGSC